jgi:hypothetical protein
MSNDMRSLMKDRIGMRFIRIIDSYPDINWDWRSISKNQLITMNTVKKYSEKPWCYRTLSKLRDLDFNFVQENIEKDWDFDSLSRRYDLKKEVVISNMDKPWDWRHVYKKFPELRPAGREGEYDWYVGEYDEHQALCDGSHCNYFRYNPIRREFIKLSDTIEEASQILDGRSAYEFANHHFPREFTNELEKFAKALRKIRLGLRRKIIGVRV